jgi:hypothetical protein
VLLFNGVVRGQVRAELQASVEELPQRHGGGAFEVFTRGVEEVPGLAKVVVLDTWLVMADLEAI